MPDRKRILLLSSSTVFGSGYLDHAEEEIRDFFGPINRVLFVPFALHDYATYTKRTRERFVRMNYEVFSLHEARNQREAVAEAEAIFVGGGNTFRLLKTLYDRELLVPIRQRVDGGMPYLGTSAGSNIAGPTIRTTNDMPIVQPPSFDALGLISLQINPHYLDPSPASTHMGETREERILQFLEENVTPVLGLREGASLRVENGEYHLRGQVGARLFQRGRSPIELTIGSKIDLS